MEIQNLTFTQSAKEKQFEIDCIPIEQPIGRFFIANIPYEKLIEITYADTRRIEGEDGSFEKLLGIQRKISDSRIKELNQYVTTYDACFPTSVILSIPESCIEYDKDNKKLKIFEPQNSSENPEGLDSNSDLNNGYSEIITYAKIAKILDGQHRIKGLEAYHGNKKFDVNVSIFVDLDPASEAYIFSIVNQAQTKVNKSLVYDLYSLAKSRSPQRLCHQVAVVLNATEESPFKDKIKRLGVAGPKTKPVAITQAAFVESLIKHVSHPRAKAVEDRDVYMRGKKPTKPSEGELAKMIFRGFLIEEKDNELIDTIWNYFDAISQKWPIAWESESEGAMLSKTNGFMAFMRLLKDIHIYSHKINTVMTKDEYLNIINRSTLSDSDFDVSKYSPGTSGESALYKKLKSDLGV